MSATATTATHPTPMFEALYQTYYARVLAYTFHLLGSREDAEDVTQETFLKIARALSTVRAEQASAWVYCIATNTACDLLRRRRVEQAHQSPEDFEVATQTLAARDDLEASTVLHDQVQQAWQRLPRQYRAVLCSLITGDTQAGQAQQRGVSVSSVKSMLYHARVAFRQAYQEVSA